MLPAIVFPLHDPNGKWFAHLASITPQLKGLFERAYVSITPPTQSRQAGLVQALCDDPFFRCNDNPEGSLIGDHFVSGYQSAVSLCPPQQVLHLCFIDRVIFALRSVYAGPFITSVQSLRGEDLPVLFQRSAVAWATHPHNYRDLEHMVTRAGELLFNQSL